MGFKLNATMLDLSFIGCSNFQATQSLVTNATIQLEQVEKKRALWMDVCLILTHHGVYRTDYVLLVSFVRSRVSI